MGGRRGCVGRPVINLVKNSRAFKCTIIIAARMETGNKNFSFAEGLLAGAFMRHERDICKRG